MLDAELIRPYVDLITWQVVALAGGFVFAPAIYVVIFRLKTLSMGLVTAGLSRNEAKAIAKEVEQEVEDEAEDEPANAPQQAADEISAIDVDEPADKKEMYKNIVQAWSNLSVIIRTLAVPHGGQKSLKAYLANLDVIAQHQLLPRDEIQRLRELHHRRFELGRNPGLLTAHTHRAYLRRARRTANRLQGRIAVTPQQPPSFGEQRTLN